nr:YdcF family protein [Clostridia bacterium]
MKIIVFIASLFSFFCLFNFFTSVLVDGGSVVVPLIALCMAAVTLLPVVLWSRLRRWLLALLGIGMCFFTVTFCIFCAIILSAANSELPTEHDDVVVLVYGCRTYADRPSPMLARRLDAAYDLLTEYPEAVCIVSGGQGPNEPVTEAFSMKRYLCALGVDEERIIMEDASHNTAENIENSLVLIGQHGLDEHTVISVSDNYHLLRIRLLADSRGLDTLVYPADYSVDFRLLASLTREYLSYIKMLVLGTAM